MHAVLMSFTPATPVSFHREVQAFATRVRQECDEVVHYFYGPNEADRAGGFTHAVIGCFADEAAHERYQGSPVHQEMKTFMAAHIDRLVVFDSGGM